MQLFLSGINLLNQFAMPAKISAVPMRRPKILLVENSLHVTGAFKSSLDLMESLTDNYDIEFILPSKSTLKSQVQLKGIIYHQLPMVEIGRSWSRIISYLPILLINTLYIRKLLFMRNIDILIINDYYNLLGTMAKITGWSGCLLTMVRLMPFNQHSFLNHVWSQCAVRCSDKVIVVSEAVKSQMPKSDKVVVIYNPARFNEKYPASMDSSVQKDLIVCLYLANYIVGKGHEYALEAFAKAHISSTALRLRFVGGDMGLEKNRDLRLALQNRVLALGLEQVVSFHGFTEDVEKEIKSAHIVLNFSESESFSHTCLEAGAYSRPVIATRCGGPEEIVENGVSGILIPVRDEVAMTNALLLLSNNLELCKSMGKAGNMIVTERFSKEEFLNKFNLIIRL